MKPIKPDINLQNDIQVGRVLESREYYKGKSFNFAGEWQHGIPYYNDRHEQTFVTIDGALVVCTKSHLSTVDNKPIVKVDTSGMAIGINEPNPYWQFVLGAVKGDKGEQGIQGQQGATGADGAKGDKGDKGDPGIGITDISDVCANGSHTITITYGDNKVEQFVINDGKDGTNGKDGNSISKIEVDGTDLVFTSTDNNNFRANIYDLLEKIVQNNLPYAPSGESISLESGDDYISVAKSENKYTISLNTKNLPSIDHIDGGEISF